MPGAKKIARRSLPILHQLHDKHVRERLGGPYQARCTLGCSACCHIRVDASVLEAVALLVPLQIRERGGIVRRARWRLAGPEEGPPCVFLNKQRCTVYERRPLACREHHSISDPSECASPENRTLRVDLAPERAAARLALVKLECEASCAPASEMRLERALLIADKLLAGDPSWSEDAERYANVPPQLRDQLSDVAACGLPIEQLYARQRFEARKAGVKELRGTPVNTADLKDVAGS